MASYLNDIEDKAMNRKQLVEMISRQCKVNWNKFASGKISRAEYNRRSQITMNYYTREMNLVK